MSYCECTAGIPAAPGNPKADPAHSVPLALLCVQLYNGEVVACKEIDLEESTEMQEVRQIAAFTAASAAAAAVAATAAAAAVHSLAAADPTTAAVPSSAAAC